MRVVDFSPYFPDYNLGPPYQRVDSLRQKVYMSILTSTVVVVLLANLVIANSGDTNCRSSTAVSSSNPLSLGSLLKGEPGRGVYFHRGSGRREAGQCPS
jgi:hypothetical protein